MCWRKPWGELCLNNSTGVLGTSIIFIFRIEINGRKLALVDSDNVSLKRALARRMATSTLTGTTVLLRWH
jgi:hypothetical protein